MEGKIFSVDLYEDELEEFHKNFKKQCGIGNIHDDIVEGKQNKRWKM
jgi:hypothetical protein